MGKKTIEVSFISEGIVKKHVAEIKVETTPFGSYEYIDISRVNVPQKELIKIANETGMPVFHRGMKIFPEGKTARDIINQTKAKAKS